jgi:RecA/RadA recombinase
MLQVPPAVAVAGSATVVVGLASGVASSLDAESALSEPRRDDAAAGGSLTRGVEEARERKGSTDEEEVAMTDRSQVSSEKDSSEEDELSEEERLLAAVAKAKASRVSELEQALELARAEQEAAAVAVVSTDAWPTRYRTSTDCCH